MPHNADQPGILDDWDGWIGRIFGVEVRSLLIGSLNLQSLQWQQIHQCWQAFDLQITNLLKFRMKTKSLRAISIAKSSMPCEIISNRNVSPSTSEAQMCMNLPLCLAD